MLSLLNGIFGDVLDQTSHVIVSVLAVVSVLSGLSLIKPKSVKIVAPRVTLSGKAFSLPGGVIQGLLIHSAASMLIVPQIAEIKKSDGDKLLSMVFEIDYLSSPMTDYNSNCLRDIMYDENLVEIMMLQKESVNTEFTGSQRE